MFVVDANENLLGRPTCEKLKLLSTEGQSVVLKVPYDNLEEFTDSREVKVYKIQSKILIDSNKKWL